MDDDELNAIRAKRMAELQANQSPQGLPGGASIGAMPGTGGSSKDEEEKKGLVIVWFSRVLDISVRYSYSRFSVASFSAQIEEMRRTMLVQILDNSARERRIVSSFLYSLFLSLSSITISNLFPLRSPFPVARIQMVKAEKARAVEDLLIRMAQGGQLRQKITETQLIDLLGQINEQEKGAKETKIVYNRRRFDDDEDDEYDL
ncbi:PDCD5-related protein [Endogone sp. FLAS-F59071]|nr:PDCD5-related protein [Endogone sp. FLAS-F59071]|eukprot:RUS13194.1 PDCD5-related protein [Endogone sp. FLAS-F59071]